MIPISGSLRDKLQDKYNNRAIKTGGSRRKKIPSKPTLPLFVFPNAKGEAYSPNNWDARVYKSFMKDLQTKYPNMQNLNLHELRHTFATNRRNDGADIFSLAKIMGHSDLNMLYKRYAHVDMDSLRKASGIEIKKSDDKE
ncbi:Tyrosine recombinase XerC [bioreactor metagenome]|uniref:Tyrosine recombinase XerC n=1 Tax=bioreactor metagenome TaxID=1076179 RepID=A0A645CLC0_9ZZZZ